MKRRKLVESEPDPAVVFFPTNQDSECMDATTGIVENINPTFLTFLSFHKNEGKSKSEELATQNAWMEMLERESRNLILSHTGAGFNTFGFLSMMIAGYNLVGLISNNGNQNNNNNDNNDNINNNNNQVSFRSVTTTK